MPRATPANSGQPSGRPAAAGSARLVAAAALASAVQALHFSGRQTARDQASQTTNDSLPKSICSAAYSTRDPALVKAAVKMNPTRPFELRSRTGPLYAEIDLFVLNNPSGCPPHELYPASDAPSEWCSDQRSALSRDLLPCQTVLARQFWRRVPAALRRAARLLIPLPAGVSGWSVDLLTPSLRRQAGAPAGDRVVLPASGWDDCLMPMPRQVEHSTRCLPPAHFRRR